MIFSFTSLQFWGFFGGSFLGGRGSCCFWFWRFLNCFNFKQKPFFLEKIMTVFIRSLWSVQVFKTKEAVSVRVFAFVAYCVFRHVYNLLNMVLLALLVWNVRHPASSPLATGPGAPSSNRDTQIKSPSPRTCTWLITCGEVPIGTSSFLLCGSFAAGFLPPNPSRAWTLVKVSQQWSFKAIYHRISCLVQNIILGFIYMNTLEKRNKCISICWSLRVAEMNSAFV